MIGVENQRKNDATYEILHLHVSVTTLRNPAIERCDKTRIGASFIFAVVTVNVL